MATIEEHKRLDESGLQVSLDVVFERRGLRSWDLFWNESLAELRGRTLSVYDLASGDAAGWNGYGEQTLLAHAVLSEDYEVKRISATDLQLLPRSGSTGSGDFPFLWRLGDEAGAERWAAELREACCPSKRPEPAAEVSACPDETQGGTLGDLIDPAFILTAMLAPGILGPVAVMSDVWGLLGYASATIGEATERDPEAAGSTEVAAVEAVAQGPVAAVAVSAGPTLLQPKEISELLLPIKQAQPLEMQLRPLRGSAQQFSSSLLGDADVHLPLYVEACRAFCGVLTLMGAWTLPMANEVHRNLGIIEAAEVSSRSSLRGFLAAEAALDIHQPGPVLADPSGALGVLWSLRGLRLWAETFRRCGQDAAREPGAPGPELKASMDSAYDMSLKPFHGWVLRNAYTLGTSIMPTWEVACDLLAPTREKLDQDLSDWVKVMDRLLPRVEAIICDLDLNDVNKTW